jgi:hypothetical protein
MLLLTRLYWLLILIVLLIGSPPRLAASGAGKAARPGAAAFSATEVAATGGDPDE